MMASNLAKSHTFLTEFADILAEHEVESLPPGTVTWILHLAERLPRSVWERHPSIQRLYDLVKPSDTNAPVPIGYDPARSAPTDQPARQVTLWQAADRLLLQPADAPPPTRASPLGAVQTANGEVTLATGLSAAPIDDVWPTGRSPAWAHYWGRDIFGPWVTFRIGEAEQRLRWMPPGRFTMGSPEDEEGRWDDEGPQYEVQLSQGFWLFDTPCTQALWQGVMGSNPSEFKGENRPVERVSWNDCQAFIQRLNQRFDGLDLGLPTEAEWEYACRAGTQTPRYAGALNQIAWFRENSDNRTHDVGEKAPNAWGLYDMLGNVYEWCYDSLQNYTAEPTVDPMSSAEVGADHVIRGGSWFFPARDARAAYRLALGGRVDYLGFRCSSSEVS